MTLVDGKIIAFISNGIGKRGIGLPGKGEIWETCLVIVQRSFDV